MPVLSHGYKGAKVMERRHGTMGTTFLSWFVAPKISGQKDGNWRLHHLFILHYFPGIVTIPVFFMTLSICVLSEGEILGRILKWKRFKTYRWLCKKPFLLFWSKPLWLLLYWFLFLPAKLSNWKRCCILHKVVVRSWRHTVSDRSEGQYASISRIKWILPLFNSFSYVKTIHTYAIVSLSTIK